MKYASFLSVEWRRTWRGAVGVAVAAVIAAPPTSRPAFAAGADACSSAVDISSVTLPYTDTTNNTAFTSAGDPTACDGSAFQKSFWYKFTAPLTGLYGVSTVGSGYDTRIAVYKATTATCGGLGISELAACNDSTLASNEAQEAFYAKAGNQYLIQVGSWGSSSATAKMTLDYGHETVVGIPKGLKVKIPVDAPSITKTIKVPVANVSNDPTGHAIAANVFTSGCPSTVTLSPVDLDPKLGGIQNPVNLGAGKKTTATFDITLPADAFLTASPKIPSRCRLNFTTYQPGTAEPQSVRSNDTVYIPVEVTDLNDL